ncbi:FAD-binding protein [Actinomadura kijaniata]|uniref:FAD-binding protein n=1 Tax=Actinomadura kijaniata TaxID=46161 RepID=UPI000837512D|nr:FAD-binding protein [Actinomadura kijaniata]
MRDFGGLVERTPRRVVRPRSARDVAAAMPGAVPRGCGHSDDGRSLTAGTLLDMRAMAAVGEVRPGRVAVEAGATWREVLDATLPHGLAPPVLTDHLDLTVGGTLSAGGIGGSSHRHGTQADNVLDLEVVTPDGAVTSCSPATRPELFDAVRAGAGRHGVITRATLRLVAVPARVVSCKIHCTGAAALLDRQRAVDAPHVFGQAKPQDGPGWRYELKAVLPAGSPLPEGAVEAEELPFPAFADRMRPDVERLVALGEWRRPHPWQVVLLPAARAAGVIERTLAETAPADIGLSGVVLVKRLAVRRVPNLRAPADPVLFGLLRTASPGATPPGRMLAANRTLLERARAVGGVPYPPL